MICFAKILIDFLLRWVKVMALFLAFLALFAVLVGFSYFASAHHWYEAYVVADAILFLAVTAGVACAMNRK